MCTYTHVCAKCRRQQDSPYEHAGGGAGASGPNAHAWYRRQRACVNACPAHHGAVVTKNVFLFQRQTREQWSGTQVWNQTGREEQRRAALRIGRKGVPPRRAGTAAVPMKSPCKDASTFPTAASGASGCNCERSTTKMLEGRVSQCLCVIRTGRKSLKRHPNCK